MKRAFFTERFRRDLRAYPEEIRDAAEKVIAEVQAAFGDPHRHAGLGVRKLSKRHFEIRCGLDVRLLFRSEPEGLVFDFAGTHDQVQRFLRGV